MARYLFSSLLLLLLVSCALCGVVSVNGHELFAGEIVTAFKPDHSSEVIYDIETVASPSMAGDDSILLGQVLAKIRTSNDYVIFTSFIEPGAGWPESADHVANWKPQVITGPDNKQTIAFGTVKKGTNFYTLYAHRKPSAGETNPWDFKLATGAITGAAGSKEIRWTEEEVDQSKVTIKFNIIGVTPKDGTAFLIGGKPVFVLRGEDDADQKNVYAIARMDGDDAGGDWTFISRKAGRDCDATFFSLDGKICMAPSGETCADKALQVWDESERKWLAPTGNVAENLKKLGGVGSFFLPVNVDGKGDVLLIDERKEDAQNPRRSDFYLHIARGKNIARLEKPIVANVANISDISLFYAKGQLFFLSQRVIKSLSEWVVIGDLYRLQNTPNEIKEVLKNWRDAAVLGNSVNMGVFLLCALFGMLVLLAL